jgi:hypothetical protein
VVRVAIGADAAAATVPVRSNSAAFSAEEPTSRTSRWLKQLILRQQKYEIARRSHWFVNRTGRGFMIFVREMDRTFAIRTGRIASDVQ